MCVFASRSVSRAFWPSLMPSHQSWLAAAHWLIHPHWPTHHRGYRPIRPQSYRPIHRPLLLVDLHGRAPGRHGHQHGAAALSQFHPDGQDRIPHHGPTLFGKQGQRMHICWCPEFNF